MLMTTVNFLLFLILCRLFLCTETFIVLYRQKIKLMMLTTTVNFSSFSLSLSFFEGFS
jgi:hypothetical protein